MKIGIKWGGKNKRNMKMVAFKMNTPRTLAQNNNSSAFLLACYGYLLPKKGFKWNISINLLSMKVHIIHNLWGCYVWNTAYYKM